MIDRLNRARGNSCS